jgi:hypothetical protein
MARTLPVVKESFFLGYTCLPKVHEFLAVLLRGASFLGSSQTFMVGFGGVIKIEGMGRLKTIARFKICFEYHKV